MFENLIFSLPRWQTICSFVQLLSNNCYFKLKWYFVIKIVLTYYDKNCSSDREKLLKFEAEGQEFAKFLRSLGQFV